MAHWAKRDDGQRRHAADWGVMMLAEDLWAHVRWTMVSSGSCIIEEVVGAGAYGRPNRVKWATSSVLAG